MLLSHLHGDHFGGLPFLVLAGRLGARRIVLTHLSPDLLTRVDEVGWGTASDGRTLELPGAEA